VTSSDMSAKEYGPLLARTLWSTLACYKTGRAKEKWIGTLTKQHQWNRH